MIDTLVILAAGRSTRMKNSSDQQLSHTESSESNQLPKCLININGRPFIDYLLNNARESGIRNIYFVTSPEEKAFKCIIGEKENGNRYCGLTISYLYQHIHKGKDKPFGTADALEQAMEQCSLLQKTSFVVCNSDNLYSVNAFQTLCRSDCENALIAYNKDSLKYSDERIKAFALCHLTSDGYLQGIIEKPSKLDYDLYRDKENKLRVSMNIFRFTGEIIYPYLKACDVNPTRNEKEMPTAIQALVGGRDNTLLAIPLDEHVADLTSKTDIHELKKYL